MSVESLIDVFCSVDLCMRCSGVIWHCIKLQKDCFSLCSNTNVPSVKSLNSTAAICFILSCLLKTSSSLSSHSYTQKEVDSDISVSYNKGGK